MELVATGDGPTGGDAKRRRVELVPALEQELYPISALRRKCAPRARKARDVSIVRRRLQKRDQSSLLTS